MAKKILIIRFSSLGDLILTTPFYRELKKQEPKAELHLVTSTSFSALLKGNPHLHRIYELDRREGKPAFAALLKELKGQDWDLVFDLHQSLRSRLLLGKLFGWAYRLRPYIHCMDKRGLKRWMLLSFKINWMKGFQSQRENYLTLLQAAYPSAKLKNHTELFPDSDAKQKIKTILTETCPNEKPLIALGAGASFPLKRWPKEYFLQLGHSLLEKGYQPILMGGEGEEESEWIAEKGEGKFIDMTGQLSYLETAALLEKCQLAISNDSAIVHFSEAMKTPALAIFGPTVKEFGFGPFLKQSLLMERDQLSCRPCSRNGKGKCSNGETLACLQDILPEDVLTEALKRLK